MRKKFQILGKKITGSFLVLLMLFSTSFNIFNIALNTVYAATDSTDSNTYCVRNEDDLLTISDAVWKLSKSYEGSTVKLCNDIELSGNKEILIGTQSKPFKGTFDGDGHIIKCSKEINLTCGIFNYIEGAKICNLGVEYEVEYKTNNAPIGGIVNNAINSKIEKCYSNVTINSAHSSGGLVGSGDNVVISECYFKGVISTEDYQNNVGGIIGKAEGSTLIENCYNMGNITVKEGEDVGGILGYSYDTETTIKNCYNVGEINAEKHVGGIAGDFNGNSITNCYNTGKICGTDNGIGGIIGYKDDVKEKMENCFNKGEVKGDENVGGIIGFDNGGEGLSNCSNSGKISGSKDVGGIIGEGETETTNCYNNGIIAGKEDVGGIIGYYSKVGSWVSLVNSYNTGNITGNNKIGGLVGHLDENIKNSYNCGKITCNSNFGGGITGYHSEGSIISCFNKGEIVGEATEFIGGITGQTIDAEISYCYNQGKVNVKGAKKVGGIVGETDQDVTKCYNSGEITGINIVGGLIGFLEGDIIVFDGTLKDSFNIGDINSSGESYNVEYPEKKDSIGSLIGRNQGNVQNCYNGTNLKAIGDNTDDDCSYAKTVTDYVQFINDGESKYISNTESANKPLLDFQKDFKINVQCQEGINLLGNTFFIKVENNDNPVLYWEVNTAIEMETITFATTEICNTIADQLKDNKITVTSNNDSIEINKDDIKKVTDLDLSNKGITDLTGIEKFTSLETLRLNSNNIGDGIWETLNNKFANLKKLELKNNNLTKIENMPSLEKCDVSGNKIEDVSLFAGKDTKNFKYSGQVIEKAINKNDIDVKNDLPQIVQADLKLVKTSADIQTQGIKTTNCSLSIIDGSVQEVKITGKSIAVLETKNAKLTIKLSGVVCELLAVYKMSDKEVESGYKNSYMFTLNIEGSSIVSIDGENITDYLSFKDSSNSKINDVCIVTKRIIMSSYDEKIQIIAHFKENVTGDISIQIAKGLCISGGASSEALTGTFTIPESNTGSTGSGSTEGTGSGSTGSGSTGGTAQTTSVYVDSIEIISPANGSYKKGQEVEFKVTFGGENVAGIISNLTTYPTLNITFKSTNDITASNNIRYAEYKEKGENYIKYKYTIKEGDLGEINEYSYIGSIGNCNVTCVKEASGSKIIATGYKEFDGGAIHLNCSVQHDNEKVYTDSRTIYITMDAMNYKEYLISENLNAVKANPVWKKNNINENKWFTLAEGEGEKTVYVWYKDYFDVVHGPFSRKITLDTKKPEIEIKSIKINGIEKTEQSVKFSPKLPLKVIFNISEEIVNQEIRILLCTKDEKKATITVGAATNNENGDYELDLNFNQDSNISEFILVVPNGELVDFASNRSSEIIINKEFEFDKKGPNINRISIEAPKSGTYKAEDEIELNVEFDENIEILSQTPALKIKIGDKEKYCSLDDVKIDSLIYKYKIQEEDNGKVEFVSYQGTINDKYLNSKEIDESPKKISMDGATIIADNIAPEISIDKVKTSSEFDNWEKPIELTAILTDNIELNQLKYEWKLVETSGQLFNNPTIVILEGASTEYMINTPTETGKYKLFMQLIDNAGNTTEFITAEFKIDNSVTKIGSLKCEIRELNSEVYYSYSEWAATSEPICVSIEDYGDDSESGHLKTNYYITDVNTDKIVIAETTSPSMITNPGTYSVCLKTEDNLGNVKCENTELVINENAQTASITPFDPNLEKIKHYAQITIIAYKGVDKVYYEWSTKDTLTENEITNKFEYAVGAKNYVCTPDNLPTGEYYLHVKVIDKAGNVKITTSEDKFNVYNGNSEIYLCDLNENNQILRGTKRNLEDVGNGYINSNVCIYVNNQNKMDTVYSVTKEGQTEETPNREGKYLVEEGKYTVKATVKTKNDDFEEFTGIKRECVINIDKTAPKVEFKGQQNVHSNNMPITITLKDEKSENVSSGINTNKTKYMWSKNPYAPTIKEFFTVTPSYGGNLTTLSATLNSPQNETGPWFLWVYVEDNAENYTIAANSGISESGNVVLTDYTKPIAATLKITEKNTEIIYATTEKEGINVGEYTNKELDIKLISGYDADSGVKENNVTATKDGADYTLQYYETENKFRINQTGVYVITVKTTDNCDNYAERKYEVKVDLTAPTIELETGEANYSINTKSEIAISDIYSGIKEDSIKYVWIEQEKLNEILTTKEGTKVKISEDTLEDAIEEVISEEAKKLIFASKDIKFNDLSFATFKKDGDYYITQIDRPQTTGDYYLLVYAKDNVENEGFVITTELTAIDNTEPTKPTIDATIEFALGTNQYTRSIYSGEKTNKNAKLEIKDSVAKSGINEYQYRTSEDNGASWTEWTKLDKDNMPIITKNGTTLVEARAKSNVDLISSVEQFVVVIDNIGPEIQFRNIDNNKNGSSEWIYGKQVEVVATDESNVNSNTLKFAWVEVENETATPTVLKKDLQSFKMAPIATPIDGAGMYKLYVCAEDSFGNISNNYSNVYKIDTIKPSIPVLTSTVTGNTFTKEDVELTISTVNSLSGVTYKYSINNGNIWNDCCSPITISNEGITNVVVKAISGVGLESEVSANYVVKIDKTAPNVIINPNFAGTSKTKEVRITIEDEASGLDTNNIYQYYLSTSKTEQIGGTWTTFTNGENITIGASLTGTYYIHVKPVKDLAGNESEIKVSESFKFNNETVVTPIPVETEIFVTSEDYIIAGTEEEKYISKILPETTIEQFLSKLQKKPSDAILTVYDLEGNAVTEGVITTGMKLKLSLNNDEIEYTLIVIGDLTKTGKITLVDVSRGILSYANKITLNKLEQMALDMDNNGRISLNDISKLVLVYAGNAKI